VEKRLHTGLMRMKQAPEASRVMLIHQRNVSSGIAVALLAATASFVVNPEAALNVNLRTHTRKRGNTITRHTKEKMTHEHIVGLRVSRVD
jgi:hypothetical protein